jgi:hypothetical protein
MRRSKAHVQDALQGWINGSSTRVGEPLITAHAQLECTSEASPQLNHCRCNAPSTLVTLVTLNMLSLHSRGSANMQLLQAHDAW